MQSGERQFVGQAGLVGRSGFGADGAGVWEDFFRHFEQQDWMGVEFGWVRTATSVTLHTGVCAGNNVTSSRNFRTPLTTPPSRPSGLNWCVTGVWSERQKRHGPNTRHTYSDQKGTTCSRYFTPVVSFRQHALDSVSTTLTRQSSLFPLNPNTVNSQVTYSPEDRRGHRCRTAGW